MGTILSGTGKQRVFVKNNISINKMDNWGNGSFNVRKSGQSIRR